MIKIIFGLDSIASATTLAVNKQATKASPEVVFNPFIAIKVSNGI
tara:strand:- start:378 stop:512 length:135 start_codon:yes stop_codon:yes gene_type:complete